MNNSPIYSLKNISYTFKQKNERTFRLFSKASDKKIIKKDNFTLGPINIDITKGKFTSILGRSGSGKTTLLSLLGLLRKEDKGNISIMLDGANTNTSDIWKEKEKNELFRAQNIGFALQKGELLPYLSLVENAMLTSNFLKKNEEDAKKKLDLFFEKLYKNESLLNQLDTVKNSKPSNVSQGQYQRGAIVRALANDPSIILADEPTGNLDEHSGREAMTIFKEIVEEYKTTDRPKSVIVVTHDLLLAIEFADEIIILSNGKQSAHLKRVNTTDWLEAYSNKNINHNIIKSYILEKLQ